MTNKSVESVNPWQSVIQTIPPGYKQTEVGVIPKEWDTKPIGEITQIFVGRDVKTCQFAWQSDNEYRYPVFSNTVENYGLYGFYNFVEYEGNSLTIVGRGIGLGKAFARSGGYGAIGRLLVLFPSQKADPRFLAEYFNKYIRIYDESSGIPQLTGISLAKYVVPLPTLGEQRAIATALSDVDALLTALDKLIAKKRDIKQAAMQELLTGKRRLPGYFDEWVVLKLGDIANNLVNGGTPSTHRSDYWTGSIPWITGADVVDQQVAVVRRFITQEAVMSSATNVVRKGNLLIATRTGVGKLALAPFDIAISQDLTGVYLNSKYATPEYVYRYFDHQSNLLRNLNQGTSIAGITRETLASMPIPLPCINEQRAIAAVLTDMDTEIAELEQKREKTRLLKQGMMQELLTGKTRLL